MTHIGVFLKLKVSLYCLIKLVNFGVLNWPLLIISYYLNYLFDELKIGFVYINFLLEPNWISATWFLLLFFCFLNFLILSFCNLQTFVVFWEIMHLKNAREVNINIFVIQKRQKFNIYKHMGNIQLLHTHTSMWYNRDIILIFLFICLRISHRCDRS